MNAHDEVQLWHALYHLEARYWHEVDSNCGRNAHEFYVPDGLMVVGHNRFEGREKIREYYAWRQRPGICSQPTRHLISRRCAKVMGIVSFYGASGRPPAPQSKPPKLVADLINECILDDKSGWQFKSHTLQPVFVSHEAPPSIAVDTHWVGHRIPTAAATAP